MAFFNVGTERRLSREDLPPLPCFIHELLEVRGAQAPPLLIPAAGPGSVVDQIGVPTTLICHPFFQGPTGRPGLPVSHLCFFSPLHLSQMLFLRGWWNICCETPPTMFPESLVGSPGRRSLSETWAVSRLQL